MFLAFAERDELDDIGMVGSSHDLHFLQDIRSLRWRNKTDVSIRGATIVHDRTEGETGDTNLGDPRPLLLEVRVQMLVATSRLKGGAMEKVEKR